MPFASWTRPRSWLGLLSCVRTTHRSRRQLQVEVLEARALPSRITPIEMPYGGGGHHKPDGSPAPLSTSFTPAQIAQAYGIGGISFNGIVGSGAGQTIAIIDAYDDPDLVSSTAANFASSDLHTFDQQFGLAEPTGFFTKVNQSGGTSYPRVDHSGGWEGEEALDVEWAHAVAPEANIILVEANRADDNLYTAVQWAEKQSAVSVISMSWGSSEDPTETSDDSYFQTPSGHQGITFLASTGDNGAPGEYPAFSPSVVAVGGTSLNVNTDGSYSSETGWSDSGGGTSTVEPEPTYQDGVQSSGMRAIPDVAFDADPNTGVAVCDAYNNGAATPWWQYGGTSLAAPCWAGLIAIADQGRAVNGFTTLDGPTQTLPMLYKVPASDFNDITSGYNGYAAGPGYDLVTGLGTPRANVLVPALAGSTQTTLATSANPVLAGLPFTLAATVTGGGAVAAPTGTVTFMDGSSALGNAAINTAGVATFVVNGLAQGTHTLTAVYSGDTVNGPSTSPPLNEVVIGITVVGVTVNGSTAPILGATEDSNNLVTITTDGPSGFAANDPVLIAGVGAGYDGAWTIASVNPASDTFTYTASASGLSAVTDQGTATDTHVSTGVLSGHQRSMVDSIVYVFNQPVSLSFAAFTIAVHGGEPGSAPTLAWASPDGGVTWVVTFSGTSVVGNSISDGVYDITLDHAQVQPLTGSGTLTASETDTFCRLFGAVSGDPVVNNSDNRLFSRAYNSAAGDAAFVAAFDFSATGVINNADNRDFALRFYEFYSGFTPTI